MKYTILALSILITNLVYACPGCAGSMNNPKDGTLVWILCGFILLTYIPFYIIYRTIIKNRHLNNSSPLEANEKE